MKISEVPDMLYNVVNVEEQYSVLIQGRPLVADRNVAGRHGTRQECLDYITAIWAEMRPFSFRQQMGCQ